MQEMITYLSYHIAENSKEEEPQKEATEDPANSSSDEDEYDDIDDDEDEPMDEGDEPTTCLFCTETSPSISTAIDHLDARHKVNLSQLQRKFQMDQYSFIKLINYIRANKITAEQLISAEQAMWQDEKYLKPGEYEPWLCYDYEVLKTDATPAQATVPELQQRIAEQSQLLQQANEDMERMRNDYKQLLQKVHGDGEPKGSSNPVPRNNASLDNEYFKSIRLYLPTWMVRTAIRSGQGLLVKLLPRYAKRMPQRLNAASSWNRCCQVEGYELFQFYLF